MKTWTSTLAATAILAVAAPAGHAANANIPADTDSSPGHHTTRVAEHPLLIDAKLRNRQQAATINALIARNRALDARNNALDARLQSALATLRFLIAPRPIVDPAPAGCRSHMFCPYEDGSPDWVVDSDPGPSADTGATDQISTGSPAAEPVAGTGPVSASSDAVIPTAPERPAPPDPPTDNGTRPFVPDPPAQIGPRTPPPAH